MARNGSGTYTLPAGQPVVTGTTISSTTHNNLMTDIANALTQSIAKDGQTPISANLPMAGFRHTGVGDAALDSQYASLGQVKTGVLTLENKILESPTVNNPTFKGYGETVNVIGSIGGGTQDINLSLGNVVSGTVDISATTFTFSNPPTSGTAGSFTLILTNGGSQTVTWPLSVKWASDIAPALTVAGVDVLTFMTVDGGTTWYGFVSGQAMS